MKANPLNRLAPSLCPSFHLSLPLHYYKSQYSKQKGIKTVPPRVACMCVSYFIFSETRSTFLRAQWPRHVCQQMILPLSSSGFFRYSKKSFSVVPTGKEAFGSHLSEWELWRKGVKKTWSVGLGDPMFLSISNVISAYLHGLGDIYRIHTKLEICARLLLDAISSL